MKRILIIDDEPLFREGLQILFGNLGFDTIEAEDGDRGLARARSDRPDLIILDMNMPGMTGWEVLPQIRSHPDTRHIPVIALSAHATQDNRDEAHDAGCDLFLSKPVDEVRVIEAVEDLIGQPLE